MKHVTITGYCDGDHEEKTLSVIERTISVDGGKPVLLDLCEPHDKIIRDLYVLMERGATLDEPVKKKPKSGRQVGGTAKPTSIPLPPAPQTCPECGHTSPTRSALGQHLRSKHDKGFRDYVIEDGAE